MSKKNGNATQVKMTDRENKTDEEPCNCRKFLLRKNSEIPRNTNNKLSYEKEEFKPLRISKKNLPHFDGRPDEDGRIFMSKYEMIGRFNYWSEKELIDHFHMCLDRTAFSWFVHNLNKCGNWADLKNGFLSFFGKNKDDFVLQEFSAKKFAIKDPNLFICQVLDYLAVTEPRASEIRKADVLYDALPRKLKIKLTLKMTALKPSKIFQRG